MTKRKRIVASATAMLGLLGAACAGCAVPSAPTEVADEPDCGIDLNLADFDRSNGNSDGSVTHLIVHAGEGHDLHNSIGDVVEESALDGHTLFAWHLRSSNSSNLPDLGRWDLSGEAKNGAALKAELRKEAPVVACELLDELAASGTEDAGDKGADLSGAISQVMRKKSVQEAEGDVKILLLTEGGVHRTHKLDLGDPETSPDDWQSTVAGIADVAETASAPTSLEVEIDGVASSAENLSAVVRENTQSFWDDTCEALTKGGTSCSAHS